MSTICAIATAKNGAIGIIRTSGSDAVKITDRIFRNPKDRRLEEAKPYSLTFGSIVDGDVVIDEVLVAVFRAPHSYTGEDSTEISCHGSPYILNKVMELLLENGARLATPGEFTQRAFLNGKLDLSQAEAVADLIASTTEASHRLAFQQMKGGISLRLAELRNELLHLTALLELELDFSDHDDLEFADRTDLFHLMQAVEDEIARLSSSFTQGNALKNGVPVAIIGAPNVGKSTLLNALLEDDRAIVSPIQGTTRDIIEDTMNLSGVTFRFIDTAGIRHTDDQIEALGIERSLKAAEKAQIIIMLNEPGVDFPAIESRPDQTIIKITNKTPEFQAISSIGLPSLKQSLLNAVSQSATDELLITNIRHKQALDLALSDIRRAIQALQASIPTDLVAEDLRLCISNLNTILGTSITPQETLNTIFSRFCIGK